MRTFLTLLFLFISTNIFAKSPVATIKGNAAGISSPLILYRYPGPLGIRPHADTMAIDSKGHFEFRTELKKEEYAQLITGNLTVRLWLQPNGVIDLQMTDTGFSASGSMAIFAQYYEAKNKEHQRLIAFFKSRHGKFWDNDSTGTDAGFLITDSIDHGKLDFLQHFFAVKKNFGKNAFIRNEKKSITYESLMYKSYAVEFDIDRFAAVQRALHHQPKTAYAFSQDIDFNDRSLLVNSGFQGFLAVFFPAVAEQYIEAKKMKFTPALMIHQQLQLIDSLAPEPFCNMAIKAILMNKFSDQDKHQRTTIFTAAIQQELTLLAPSDHDHLLDFLQTKLDGMARETKFRPGAPAPPFQLTDTSGKVYRPEDFKGKRIYIDMWAIWCVHCIELMPAWDKLVSEYQSNDSIVFLSVSFDEKREDWINYVRMHPHKGLLLHAGNGGWNSGFAKEYDVHSLPQFMLIDEKGKLLQYTAPRPDEYEALRKLF